MSGNLTTNEQILESLERWHLNSEAMSNVINGDENTDVTLPLGGTSKTRAKLFAEFEAVKAQYVAETTTAGQQATIATTKAAEAAASQVVIQAAEANVISIQDAMVILFDNFDDRFLGVKTSDPTVDNDGDPLQIGTIYYNSTESVSKFYNGSSWESPDVTATQAASLALSYRDTTLGYRNETLTFRNEGEGFKNDAEAAKTAAETAAASVATQTIEDIASQCTLSGGVSSVTSITKITTGKLVQVHLREVNLSATSTQLITLPVGVFDNALTVTHANNNAHTGNDSGASIDNNVLSIIFSTATNPNQVDFVVTGYNN